MFDPEFRARLFRFVDAFPALKDDADIEAHLRDEFEGADVPTWFGAGLGIAEWMPGGSHLSAAVARRTIDRMAQQFIIGTDPDETATACGALWRRHTAATVDVLGEHTHSESEADRYAARLEALVVALADASDSWPVDDLLEADDLGPVPKASVSVKVTALAPSFTMLTAEQGIEQATRRLLPILEIASDRRRLGLVRHGVLRGEGPHPPALPDPHGAARHGPACTPASSSRPISATQPADLESFAVWAAGRPIPPGVRLVKGAYWDTETIHAEARGLDTPRSSSARPRPTPTTSVSSASLHSHHGVLRAAFGSHNLRSLAVVITEARRLGIPDNGYEIQLLYGMAEPVHDAMRRLGVAATRLRPDGRARPGHGLPGQATPGEHLERELRPPPLRRGRGLGRASRRLRTSRSCPDRSHWPCGCATDPRRPCSLLARAPRRVAQARRSSTGWPAAVAAEFSRPTRRIDAIIGGKGLGTGGGAPIVSIDPADPVDRRRRGNRLRAGRDRRGADRRRAGCRFLEAHSGY